MNIVTETILKSSVNQDTVLEPAEKNILKEVLQCGQASTGGQVHFYVISSRNKLSQLCSLMEQELARMRCENQMLRNSNRISGLELLKNGSPALIVLACRKADSRSMMECFASVQNMMIAAAGLNLCAVRIPELSMLELSEKARRFFSLLPDQSICCAIAAGRPGRKNTGLARVKIYGSPIHYLD